MPTASIPTIPLRPDRSLLNPNFDGYRLRPFPDNLVIRNSLPTPLQVPRLSSAARLSYRQLHSRVHFNHLSNGAFERKSYYVDSTNNVICVEFNEESKLFKFHKIFTLSDPELPPEQREYPCIKALDRETILVSDGCGTIHLVRIASDEPATDSLLGSCIYTSSMPRPCMLLDAKRANDRILCLVCYIVATEDLTKEEEAEEHEQELNKTKAYASLDVHRPHFNVALVEIPTMADGSLMELRELHLLRGIDIPLYAAIAPSGSGYMIGAEGEFKLHDLFHEKQKQEKSAESTIIYSWNQTTSDLTVSIRLPPGTPTSAIQCVIERNHIRVHVPQLEFDSQLYDLINPDGSLWTYERNELSLHLQKHHTGNRWPHLLAHDDGVLEQLDPSEVVEISESLEKFTSGFGNSVLGEEIDDELDTGRVGEDITFAWYDNSGKCSATIKPQNHNWLCTSFTNYSYPDWLPSICLRSDVDGLIYTFSPAQSTSSSISSSSFEMQPLPFNIHHTATFDALAFIQSSKREKRFMHHDTQGKLAMIIEGTHNAYIYWGRKEDQRPQWLPQSIIDLTYGVCDVLGVQMVAEGWVVVLTELEAIAIKVNEPPSE
ncbi:uncharacterized protein VTP21DRAFT_780 [Calcarisporiella thermophila]|uniref:uncharacterized protein n=1 Tax=Calcarisporiella thermophila TaxID=911321 RepID=UPI0037440BD0